MSSSGYRSLTNERLAIARDGGPDEGEGVIGSDGAIESASGVRSEVIQAFVGYLLITILL